MRTRPDALLTSVVAIALLLAVLMLFAPVSSDSPPAGPTSTTVEVTTGVAVVFAP